MKTKLNHWILTVALLFALASANGMAELIGNFLTK